MGWDLEVNFLDDNGILSLFRQIQVRSHLKDYVNIVERYANNIIKYFILVF